MVETVKFFGISLENKKKEDILAEIANYLDGKNKHLAVTPNPEMLVLARKNEFFRNILKTASLRLIDGFGLVLAARIFYDVRLERYPGVEAVRDIVALAAQKDKKIFLLGGNETVLKKLIAVWSHEFPDLQIMGAVGPKIKLDHNTKDGFSVDDMENEKTIQLIQDFVPDALLAGFGHGKQELWLSAMLPKLPSVRLAMGVGGSFDYLSGTVSRAPVWMRTVGLEWLYRLTREPCRIWRIFDAVCLFPFYLLNSHYGRKKTNF